MPIKRVCALSLLVIVLWAMTGCLSNPPRYEGGAELAKQYRSLKNLYDDADLIVLGTFTDDARMLPSDKPGSLAKIYLQGFSPQSFIKGAASSPIWVAIYARQNPETDKWIGTAGQALYQDDSTYVLFLNQTLRSKNFYWTTGAWQGSLRVKNGKVWSRAELGESEPSPLEINGQTLSDFLNTLSNIQ